MKIDSLTINEYSESDWCEQLLTNEYQHTLTDGRWSDVTLMTDIDQQQRVHRLEI